VRDGVFAARAGLPAVAILTEEFVTQGDFVAKAVGMPAVPRVIIEHPVSGTGKENLMRVARDVAPLVLAALAEGKA
jgi:hypothetical protein